MAFKKSQQICESTINRVEERIRNGIFLSVSNFRALTSRHLRSGLARSAMARQCCAIVTSLRLQRLLCSSARCAHCLTIIVLEKTMRAMPKSKCSALYFKETIKYRYFINIYKEEIFR